MTSLSVLRVLSLCLLGCAVLGVSWALLSAPRVPVQHLGLRGYKRARSLRENALFALLEPLIRLIARRIAGLVSPQTRAKLDEQLAIAGDVAGLQPEELVALTVMSSVSGVVLGLYYRGISGMGLMFAMVFGLAGVAIPQLYISNVAQTRQRAIALATPSMIDLLALCLGAGLDFPTAVRQIVERGRIADDPLQEELGLLLQELSVGQPRRKALTVLAKRAPCEPIRELVGSVVQSEEQGTPLAEVLRVQAASARVARSSRAEEIAAKAASSMMLPLALLFICVLVLIIGPVVFNFMNNFKL